VSKMADVAYEAELVSTALRASQRIAELETVLRELLNEVIPDAMRDSSPIVRNAEAMLEKEW
jgi:hypothetical protein